LSFKNLSRYYPSWRELEIFFQLLGSVHFGCLLRILSSLNRFAVRLLQLNQCEYDGAVEQLCIPYACIAVPLR
jgi:hypothetical protein